MSAARQPMEPPMLIDRGPNNWRRAVRTACLALAAGVAACGGSTSQIEPFQPERIVLVGDENAGLLPDGRNHAVNGIDANTSAIACAAQPIWTQQLVGDFGLVLDNCKAAGATDVRGITRTAAGAKAADLDAQIDAQLAAGPVGAKDLFVVMVGMHDIVDVYENFAGSKECNPDTRVTTDIERELGARGHHVAEQVNRLVAAGARVILSTVHDIGLTPYARAKDAASPGQAAQLSCLTAAFNARLRVDIVQDGRYIGLILADDATQQAVRFPGLFYGLSNWIDEACTTAPPACTTATLVAGASAGSYLWADDLHFGQVMHSHLASLAITRARNNPF